MSCLQIGLLGGLQGKGRLVFLARGLSPLWVPWLFPPGPDPWSLIPRSSLVSAAAQIPAPHWPQAGNKADGRPMFMNVD